MNEQAACLFDSSKNKTSICRANPTLQEGKIIIEARAFHANIRAAEHRISGRFRAHHPPHQLTIVNLNPTSRETIPVGSARGLNGFLSPP
jgi:hypothetical protein